MSERQVICIISRLAEYYFLKQLTVARVKGYAKFSWRYYRVQLSSLNSFDASDLWHSLYWVTTCSDFYVES